MESKYELPSDPQELKKLLADLQAGKIKLEDLEQDSVAITLNCHPTDQERLEFAQHMADQDNLNGDSSKVYFTISMPDFNKQAIDPGYLQALVPAIPDTVGPVVAQQPVNQPAQQVSDSYWDFGTGGSGDRVDRIAGHLRNLRNS